MNIRKNTLFIVIFAVCGVNLYAMDVDTSANNSAQNSSMSLIEREYRLPAVKSLILKGANLEKALFFDTLQHTPKLALLYYKYGAKPDCTLGDVGQTALIYHMTRLFKLRNDDIQCLKNLVLLGVPLNAKISKGPYAGCPYDGLLIRFQMELTTNDLTEENGDTNELSLIIKMQKAINEAIAINGQIKTQRKEGLPLELSRCLGNGPRDIDKLILSYDNPEDHIISLTTLQEIEKVDAEADGISKEKL